MIYCLSADERCALAYVGLSLCVRGAASVRCKLLQLCEREADGVMRAGLCLFGCRAPPDPVDYICFFFGGPRGPIVIIVDCFRRESAAQ